MMMPQLSQRTAEYMAATLSAEDLEPVVCRLLNGPARPVGWEVELLGGLDSSPMAGGVYKVTGSATMANGDLHEWCAVVKVLRSPAGFPMPDGTRIPREMADDPLSFGYWRREVLVGESDLLADLPPGLRAPRFLGTTPVDEGECWLWQECLGTGSAWTWDAYRDAAYRLGSWQGKGYRRKWDAGWLSHNWLAGWVHGPLTRIFGLVEGMDGYDHPLLAAYFAPEELAALRGLWASRDANLARLARRPQTLCHLDAHRGNLSWQGDRLALIDWAFAGTAALGEELAAFVGGTLLLDYLPLSEAERLEETAFEGYLAGLRAAGWTDDPALIREAYRLAMPLRYAPPSLASMLRTVLDPEFAAEWERKCGKPLEAILAHRAGLVRFYLSRTPYCDGPNAPERCVPDAIRESV